MGLCERCEKAQATFHLTNINSEGDKLERHLCDRCAYEEGLLQVSKQSLSAELIEQFVSHAKPTEQQATADLVCDQCGISYLEYRNQGVLGCAADYAAFKERLAPLIARAHDGATSHVGKAPAGFERPHNTQHELRTLRRQLEEAVSGEDYERAAQIRDKIRKLEEE